MAQLVTQHITVPGLSVGRGRFADTLWSPENVPGGFNGATDVWTPGRGSDGRVTSASWDLVPLNRWVEVAGTRFDALDAVVKASIPGFTDRGMGGWGGCLKAWSALALDPTRPRAFFFGGGHQDSTNNGLYRIDFDRMQWAVEIMPTDLTGVDPDYNLSNTVTFTNFPAAASYEQSNPGQNVVFRDEYYGLPGPRKPTARHTYTGVIYDPVRNFYWMGRERLWRADLNTGLWSAYIPFGVNVGTYYVGLNPSIYYMGSGVTGWYDELRDTICMGGGGSPGSVTYEHDPDSGTWGWLPRNPLGSAGWKAAFCRHGRKIYGFVPNDGGGVGPWFYTLDMDNRSTDSYQGLSGDVSAALWKGDSDGHVMAYVPEVDKFFVMGWYRENAGASYLYRQFWLDPVALTLTLIPAAPGNFYSTALSGSGMYSLSYVRQLHALVVAHESTQGIRIMRFA